MSKLMQPPPPRVSDDDDDDMVGDGVSKRRLTEEQVSRVQHKLANIPTLAQLLDEPNPHAMTEEDYTTAENVARELVAMDPQNEEDMKRCQKNLMRKYRTDCKKSVMLAGYKRLRASGVIPRPHDFLEGYLQSKGTRSHSGVLVVTVFTSAYPEDENGKPQTFSCKWNCYYCPNEPGQPRSYLLNEPGVRRANQLGFDPVAQFVARVGALVAIGHPADKIELLVLGGTWESYPDHYRVRFIRDLFYAANTFFDASEARRERLTLAEEQALNRTAMCKIIGVTLETRPDTINPEMLVRLRQMGCTRVQLGVQHTDDSILSLVNRDATRGDTARAIRLLKDACFKVDVHLMPDLPGASPDVDKRMFDDVLNSEELQADQWKIYPCQTTPFTVIHRWFEEGRYRSYGLDALIDVLLYAKRRVHPWIRLNRVIRDIPVEYVLEGVEVANLRQLLLQRLAKEGRGCQCMRCREVKADKDVAAKLRVAELKERWYRGSGADEVFISFETPDEQTLFGFLRLRLPPLSGIPETPFPELKHGVALIRELHVYGSLVVARAAAATSGRAVGGHGAAQHAGLGQRLLQRAEELAISHGYGRIAVISGVGVRDYYARRGYVLTDAARGAFMLKPLRVSRAGSVAAAARAVTVGRAQRWYARVAADVRTVVRFLSGAPDGAEPAEAALTTPAAVKAAAAGVAEEQALMAQMPAPLRGDAARCLDIARRRQSRSRSRDAAAALGRAIPSRTSAQLALQRLVAKLVCVLLVIVLLAVYVLRS